MEKSINDRNKRIFLSEKEGFSNESGGQVVKTIIVVIVGLEKPRNLVRLPSGK